LIVTLYCLGHFKISWIIWLKVKSHIRVFRVSFASSWSTWRCARDISTHELPWMARVLFASGSFDRTFYSMTKYTPLYPHPRSHQTYYLIPINGYNKLPSTHRWIVVMINITTNTPDRRRLNRARFPIPSDRWARMWLTSVGSSCQGLQRAPNNWKGVAFDK